MDEIEELRMRIDGLEARIFAASVGQDFNGAGNAQFAADTMYAVQAEKDHEVFWDDETSKWAVRFTPGAFTYAGKPGTPTGFTGTMVPVAEGAELTIYGHAVMEVGERGKVTQVSSLVYDTSASGATPSDDQVAFDFLVATISKDVVYQNVIGAVHVGGDVVRDAKLTLVDEDGAEIGTFTANAKEDVEIEIPSQAEVNDGQLTLVNEDSETLGTFTANQSSDTTVTIPSQAKDGELTIETADGTSLGTFTANQDDDVTITLPEIPTPWSGTVDFVGAVRYDVSTRQLQQRIDTLNKVTGVVTQGGWEMIVGGQAVPHSGEQ